jgi:hypothetical protein
LGYDVGAELLLIVGLAELSLLLIVLRAVYIGVRSREKAGGSPWLIAEKVLGQVASPAVAPALISELKVIFAFLRVISFRPARPRASAGARDVAGQDLALSSWSGSQYRGILLGLLLLLAVEAPLVHLLIGNIMDPGTAVTVVQRLLLGLSVYGAIWLIGDARLMKESSHLLGPDGLDVSLGLRWRGHIPYRAMAGVEATAVEGEPAGGSVVSITPVTLDVPNVILRLREPVELTGLFGIRKAATEVRLYVDEPRALVDHLKKHLVPAHVGLGASVQVQASA